MTFVQILAVCAVACAAVAILSAYAAWPRLRALEARGGVKTPVPDLLEGRVNRWRETRLIWATPIPADHKRLQRLLLVCRTAQVATALFFIAAMITMGSSGAPGSRRHTAAYPPVEPVIVREPAA